MENNTISLELFEGNLPYIFVSYSRDDEDMVMKDLSRLNKEGFRIWFDKAILGGEEWEKSIQKHINDSNCRLFVIYLSINSLKSIPVHDEITLAKARKNKDELIIFPVFIEYNDDEINKEYKFLKESSRDYQNLKEINGITRPVKPNEKYYSKFISLLEIARPNWNCRKDYLDYDAETLGLGFFPTIADIYSKKEIDFEKRQQNLIRKMRDEKWNSYKIENIFQLTSDQTKALENLEEKDFKEIMSKSNKEKLCNLVTLPLDIGKTYVAPLRLISGLITRLDDNWPPLVTSYGNLVKQGRADLLDDLHYFIEFCWLAWGPSVLTTSDASTKNFVVLQAAYGDEANSLPLIMKSIKWQEIKADLNKTQNSFSGWPVSLKNVILVKPGIDDYFLEVRCSELFKDMFTDKNKDKVAIYLPAENDGYACGEIELIEKPVYEGESNLSSSFYSTAYVWLMLEQIDKSEIEKGDIIKTEPLQPGEVLPFFEHANLATKKGLSFLQHCLARKAIYHVLECENDEDYREQGYYQFATALFPDEMLAILRAEIDKLNEAQKNVMQARLIIPKSSGDCRTSLDVVRFADSLNNAIKDQLITHKA